MADGAAGHGMSTARLERITRMLTRCVDDGTISGAVASVERRGTDAYLETVGWRDMETRDPMRADTLFRIASMTKPVTVVAALTLVEDGVLRLGDPVDDWLPELAGRPVLAKPSAALDDTVPLARPITLRDLCTHRAGIISPGPLRAPLGEALRELGDLWSATLGPDEWIAELGKLPLLFQPGTRFTYGISHDVLGVLVARATGMPFADALGARIFGPLGMADTAFYAVDPSRLAVPYRAAPEGDGLVRDTNADTDRWHSPPAMPSGAGGLVSSLDDFRRFGGMLLRGGAIDGTRVLSRKTVDIMTTDMLTPEQRATTRYRGTRLFFDYRGYGLGVSIVDDLSIAPAIASKGSFGWGGFYGTWWSADPSEEMLLTLMLQVTDAEENLPVAMDFQTLAVTSIDD